MSSATTRQAGITERIRRALYDDARREFYAHYDACPSCKPTHRCQVGKRLQDAYTVDTLAASAVSLPGRGERIRSLDTVPMAFRKSVRERAEQMWPEVKRLQSEVTECPRKRP